MPERWWFSFRKGAPKNAELFELSPYAYEAFLESCHDPAFPSWKVVDAAQVFPDPPGSVEARGKGLPHGYEEVKAAIVAGTRAPAELPELKEALTGIEHVRKVFFEDWMAANRFDLVAFPANADIGKADADVNEASYEAANRNGVWFSNMNHAMRHLGIPSVSVPMGSMKDTGMPVNLTLIGPAYSDARLLSYAYAYEQATHNRRPPPRTPPLDDEVIAYDPASTIPPARRAESVPPEVRIDSTVTSAGADNALRISGMARDASGIGVVRVYVDGHKVAARGTSSWSATFSLAQLEEWRAVDPSHVTVLVLAKDTLGNAAAALSELALPRAAR